MNAFMADALLDYKERDAFWVHDYHWLTLGAELRDRRVDRPIGFFLHTPWPAPGVMQLVRPHRELIEAMLAYDLAGFQTDEDRQNFLACVRAELGLTPSEDGVVISPRGITRCQVFPIGIDTDKFARYAKDASSNPDVSKLLDGLNREKLAVGVDRLDYTKGIDNRIQAVGRALDKKPNSIALLQVATSSRDGIRATEIIRTTSKLLSTMSTLATARTTGCRSATRPSLSVRRCSRVSTAPHVSAS